MPQVDFYVHNVDNLTGAGSTVCRLTEKAYHSGLKVFIQTSSEQDTKRLDDLLWTYKEESFLPHGTIPDQSAHTSLATPVLIGSQPQTNFQADLLINLTNQLPSNPSDYQRIAEFVYNNTTDKEAARDRFRHYRDSGCTLNTHEINR